MTTLFVVVVSLLFGVSSAERNAERGTSDPVMESVKLAMLDYVTQTQCQATRCVLSVARKPIKREWLVSLQERGQILALEADDFVVRDGVTKAMSERKAVIYDIVKVKIVTKVQARVWIGELRTVLDGQECQFDVILRRGKWAVSTDAPQCTM